MAEQWERRETSLPTAGRRLDADPYRVLTAMPWQYTRFLLPWRCHEDQKA
jgi:hypothetical protein